MKKRLYVLAALLIVASMVLSACGGGGSGGASSGPVEIRWFIGLGTGGDPTQVEAQQKVVDAFNASHPDIKLVMEVVTYDSAKETLATEITSGNPPDIVGPAGVSGAENFHGLWLDLSPMIKESNYDLSQFDKTAVDMYNTGGEGQLGLPFAIYPSVLFYQKGMFDEAKLNYPPTKVGEKYKWPDGTEEEWNFATLQKLAMKLTVDESGKTADQEGFDPTKVAQYGFNLSYNNEVRSLGSYFGADRLVEEDGKTARIPPQWEYGWNWYYDSMWKYHFSPDDATLASETWGAGSGFNSGKIAMALTYLWYTCCIDEAGENWDLAVVPSYNGTTTANLNADTFRILKASKHPKEAFTVLSYFLNEGAKDLLLTYAGFPARKADQSVFIDDLNTKYPWKPDWQVMLDMVTYADIPNNESYMPNYNEAITRVQTLTTLLGADGNLDMKAEVAKFKSDLQAIFDKK